MPTASVHQQVVDLTEEYLGPSAERFIDRQVSFHLKKKPQALTKADLRKLGEWIKVSIGLLTEDRKMVDDFSKRLKELS